MYQQKVMVVYRNKEDRKIKKDFDKWKKEAQAKIKLFKQGKLDEDALYKWMEENKYHITQNGRNMGLCAAYSNHRITELERKEMLQILKMSKKEKKNEKTMYSNRSRCIRHERSKKTIRRGNRGISNR